MKILYSVKLIKGKERVSPFGSMLNDFKELVILAHTMEQALELITYDTVKGLTYSDELPLVNGFIIRHYYEEDLVVVVAKEEWEEVATVLYNDETKSVEFEMH